MSSGRLSSDELDGGTRPVKARKSTRGFQRRRPSGGLGQRELSFRRALTLPNLIARSQNKCSFAHLPTSPPLGPNRDSQSQEQLNWEPQWFQLSPTRPAIGEWQPAIANLLEGCGRQLERDHPSARPGKCRRNWSQIYEDPRRTVWSPEAVRGSFCGSH